MERNFIPLIRVLKKFYPEFDSEKLNAEYISKVIQPGNAYKTSSIKSMLSGLYKLAKEFLIYDSFRKNHYFTPILVKELSIRKLDKEADKIILETEEKYSSHPIDENYYDKDFFYTEKINHFIRMDRRNEIPKALDEAYSVLLFHLLNQIMMLRNLFFNNRLFSKQNYKDSFIESTIRHINLDELTKMIEITHEKEGFMFLVNYFQFETTNFDEGQFYIKKIRSLTEKYKLLIDDKVRRSIYIGLSNICLNNISYGNENFEEIFESVYLEILRDNLYSNNDRSNYFAKQLFKAIIVTSLKLQKTDWAKNFLKKYINNVDPDFRDQLYYYSKACIAFHEKKYAEALEFTVNIDRKQIIYKVDTINLLARIYFETKAYTTLESLIDSGKHLLKNAGIKDEIYYNSNKNFLTILNLMVKSTTEKDHSLNDEIRQKILTTHPLIQKAWLLEKVK